MVVSVNAATTGIKGRINMINNLDASNKTNTEQGGRSEEVNCPYEKTPEQELKCLDYLEKRNVDGAMCDECVEALQFPENDEPRSYASLRGWN